jgi:hypothetical protein
MKPGDFDIWDPQIKFHGPFVILRQSDPSMVTRGLEQEETLGVNVASFTCNLLATLRIDTIKRLASR